MAELQHRLAEHRLRVLVVGEAKRGKSSLVNALLGTAMLPTGVTPVTALATALRHGESLGLQIEYGDRVEQLPMAAMAKLVTESGNPGNHRGITRVTAYLPAPLLAGGVELVDTPGVGSVFAHNSAEAAAALETMDAAILVLTADPPISASERDLLHQVRGRSVALFVVLNKIDAVGADEWREAAEFTAGIVGDALGAPATIYPVSARLALSAKQRAHDADLQASGLARFEADLTGYLTERAGRDLVVSISRHAHRLATRYADAATLTLRAAALTAQQATDQVSAFRQRLDALDTHRRDAADVVRASAGRLLADVNDAARRDTPKLTSQVRTAVAGYLDEQLATARPAEVERDGRRHAVDVTCALVDAWRDEQRQLLQRRLASLDARLTATLCGELDGVRAAALHLLGVELTLPDPVEPALGEGRFSYATGSGIGTTVELATALRQHLPGRLGRRLARRHLMDELDDLVGKQVGRARSAFQQSLAEATRVLLRAVDQRYTDAVGGLIGALDAAATLADAANVDAATQRADLSARLDDLRALTADLDAHAGQPART